MSGVTLSDLSKYHQGAMKWFKDGLVSEQNKLFAQTEEAGAVSFWPLGGTPLEGKVKFSFKETPPASGDKGPENPSAIAGVSSIAVGKCGKNLLPKNTVPYNYYGVTASYNSDGCLVFNGSYTGDVQRYYANTDGSSLFGSIVPCSMKLDVTKQYKLWIKLVSGTISGASFSFVFGNKDHQLSTSSSNWSVGTTLSITVPVGYCDFFILRTNINPNIVFNNAVLQIQLEEGTEITDFEPPMSASEIKSSIQLGDTYYGGEIDLATGVMTVTHVGFQPSRTYLQSSTVVATGTQNIWQIYLGKISSLPANTFNYNDAAGYGGADYRCNYFQWDRTGNTKSFHTSGGFVYASFEGATAEEARQNCLNLYDTAVANNNPLTVVYPLATPYTVQLDPLQLTALTQKDKYTPRINTVYTDADSIQIRYRKSLIHDEDEKVQAIVALGGNV